MKKLVWFASLIGLVLFSAVSMVAAAIPPSYTLLGANYYKVVGSDPNADSGDKVCAMVGQPCMGYTDFTTNVCKGFHPDASVTTSFNGSKAGFYCNGTIQGDIACNGTKNNCQVCPNCGVNMDCSTEIGSHFAEAFVQCGIAHPPAVLPWWVAAWQALINWFKAVFHIKPQTSTPAPAPSSSHPSSAPAQGSKGAGQTCNNGGECQSGQCVSDGSTYRCSCSNTGFSVIGPLCQTGSNAPAPAGSKTPGQMCNNGGECKSGQCVSDGSVYRCSCNNLSFSTTGPFCH